MRHHPDHLRHLLQDGGYRSRKLWLSFVCLAVLAGFCLLAGRYSVISGLYSQLVTGVLGVLSIYCGSNAAGSWGVAKHVGSELAKQGQDEPDFDPEAKARGRERAAQGPPQPHQLLKVK